VNHFARPGIAIAFGAFSSVRKPVFMQTVCWISPAVPLELPVYDWTAGGFLLVAGVLSRRDRTTACRQYLAVAWAFMLSLLVGASYEMLGEWGGPPDQTTGCRKGPSSRSF
jgi:hypothetical protein